MGAPLPVAGVDDPVAPRHVPPPPPAAVALLPRRLPCDSSHLGALVRASRELLEARSPDELHEELVETVE